MDVLGGGTPPEERFPRESESILKGLIDELETCINRQQEAAAKNAQQ